MFGLIILLIIVALSGWFGYNEYQRRQWTIVTSKQIFIPTTKATTADGKIVYVGDTTTVRKCQDLAIGGGYNSFSHYNTDATTPNGCFVSMGNEPMLIATTAVTSGYRPSKTETYAVNSFINMSRNSAGYDNKKLYKTMGMGGAGKEKR